MTQFHLLLKFNLQPEFFFFHWILNTLANVIANCINKIILLLVFIISLCVTLVLN